MKKYFIPSMLALNILGYIPGVNILFSEQMFFQVSAILTIMVMYLIPQVTSCTKEQDDDGLRKSLSFLVVLAVLNAVVHSFDVYTLNSMINLFLGVMVVMFLRCSTYETTKYAKISMVVLTFCVLAIVFLKKLTGYNPLPFESPEYGAFMGNEPRVGNLIGIILPVAYSLHPVIALILTICSVALRELLPIAVSVLLVAINSKKWRWYIAGISIVAVVLMFEHIKGSLIIRVTTWSQAIQSWFNNPVKGVGFGLYFGGKENIAVGSDNMIFSSLLKFVTGIGLLSLPWIAYAQSMLKIRFKPCDSIPLALILMSTTEYPFEIGKLWYVIAVLLSIWIVERGGYRENSVG